MAGTRNSAGINVGGAGSKFINPLYKAAKSVTSYVGNVAREVRDIPTAVGTGNKQEIKMQLKEAGAAVTSGQKGSGVTHKTALGDVSYGSRRDGRSA